MKKILHEAGLTGPTCGKNPFLFPNDIAVTTDQEVTCPACIKKRTKRIVDLLGRIDVTDEQAHSDADDLLLEAVHPDIATAYRLLESRAKNWPTV